MPIGPNLITDGLVLALDAGNLKSYTGTGSTWYDLTGNNNAELNNGPTFDSEDRSIILDGVDDRISLDYQITLSGPFTWSFIGYSSIMNSGQNRQVYFSGNGTWFEQSDNDTLFIVNINEGSFNLELPNDITPQDMYYSISVKRKYDNTFDYYFNGIKQNLRNGQSIQKSSDYYIKTIGYTAGREWNGGISRALIYNRELTDSEILQNYNATKKRFGL